MEIYVFKVLSKKDLCQVSSQQADGHLCYKWPRVPQTKWHRGPRSEGRKRRSILSVFCFHQTSRECLFKSWWSENSTFKCLWEIQWTGSFIMFSLGIQTVCAQVLNAPLAPADVNWSLHFHLSLDMHHRNTSYQENIGHVVSVQHPCNSRGKPRCSHTQCLHHTHRYRSLADPVFCVPLLFVYGGKVSATKFLLWYLGGEL